jgi:2-keto-3-deoxy-L-rhamnonate aldolase RhmA
VSKTQPSDIVLGLFQQLAFPRVSRYLAQQGWDWIILDMQHGSFDYESAYECIHTLRSAGAKPIVRVSVGNYSEIQKVLDLGALGVVVPMVNSRQEAKQAAEAAKYPPLGNRSKGGDLARHYGANYFDRANQETVLLVQIEHIQAVKSVEQILSLEGVDGCFMGQVDLALSMGLSPNNFASDPEHKAAIQKTVDQCRSLNKLAGYNAFSLEEAEERKEQGFRCITMRSDVDIFLEASEQLLGDLRNRVGSH